MPAPAAASAATPIDELTLRRAQRGDPRAWHDLVTRYAPPIHALVWRLLAGRSRHRVPDLVQETFVRALTALPRFDPAGPASLSTWMLTIAARLTLNELRRPDHARLADHDRRGHAAAAADPGERADAALGRARLAAALATGVAQLPDPQRAVLVLREYHDLDYAEIASILELDLNTVKSRLSRARLALRAHLEAHDG